MGYRVPVLRTKLVRERSAYLDELPKLAGGGAVEMAGRIFGELLRDEPCEVLAVMGLTTKNRVIGVVEVFRGGVASAMVEMAPLFRPLLLMNAAAFILAHNHPSGDPEPSPEDILQTRKIADAAALMEVQFLDHIIIGERGYVSLRERGLWFWR